MILNPSQGETCKFSFVKDFSVYDGIYQVLGVVSYDDVLLEDEAALLTLYENSTKEDPVGEYEKDYQEYMDDQIYKLRHVTEEMIIFVPSKLFNKVPDPYVYKYRELGMIASMGIFANEEILASVTKDIEEMLLDRAGIATDVILYSVKDIWLTEKEYDKVKATRDAYKKDTITNYTEYAKVLEENHRLKTMLDEYERLIVSKQI